VNGSNKINVFEGFNELNSTLIEIKSLKLYYNKYAKKYNELISKFKYILLKIIRKEQKMELFEIPKEIEFEILKSNKKQQ
jgi:NADPH-dependent 7-cyano-7-deazaguanine reductase QueF-like protein